MAKIEGEGVRLEWVELDALPAFLGNPKLHDIEGITQSILDFGFTDPCLLDERTGLLVAGHGRVEALKRLLRLGAKAPQGVQEREHTWAVQVRRGWSSANDAEALARLLADNGLTMAGGHDDGKLLDALSTIAGDASELLRSTGFSSDDLDRLLDEVGAIEPEPSPPPKPSGTAPWDRETDVFTDPPRPPDPDWQPPATHTVGQVMREEPPETGPLSTEPAWRFLMPLRCVHYSHGRERIEKVVAGLDVIDVDGVYKIGHGDLVLAELHPDHWLVRDSKTGHLTEYAHTEFLDTIVPANEPARRLQRDAETSPRHGRKS